MHINTIRRKLDRNGRILRKSGDCYLPGYAEIARVCGAEGVRISAAAELLPALKAAIASGRATALDVPVINDPAPTAGRWNVLDIHSPGRDVSHVST